MELMSSTSILIPNIAISQAKKAYEHAINVQKIPVAKPEFKDIDEIVIAYCLGVGTAHIESWTK